MKSVECFKPCLSFHRPVTEGAKSPRRHQESKKWIAGWNSSKCVKLLGLFPGLSPPDAKKCKHHHSKKNNLGQVQNIVCDRFCYIRAIFQSGEISPSFLICLFYRRETLPKQNNVLFCSTLLLSQPQIVTRNLCFMASFPWSMTSNWTLRQLNKCWTCTCQVVTVVPTCIWVNLFEMFPRPPRSKILIKLVGSHAKIGITCSWGSRNSQYFSHCKRRYYIFLNILNLCFFSVIDCISVKSVISNHRGPA